MIYFISKICLICATIRDAKVVSADNIKILVSGRMYKTHAANIPTTVDLPECRKAINRPRCGALFQTSTKKRIILR